MSRRDKTNKGLKRVLYICLHVSLSIYLPLDSSLRRHQAESERGSEAENGASQLASLACWPKLEGIRWIEGGGGEGGEISLARLVIYIKATSIYLGSNLYDSEWSFAIADVVVLVTPAIHDLVGDSC